MRDSRTFVPGKLLDFAFIDGDHSYAGVKADFENLAKSLNRGADVLFHDSCASRPFATNHEPVAAYMTELKESSRLVWQKEIGSITHFQWSG